VGVARAPALLAWWTSHAEGTPMDRLHRARGPAGRTVLWLLPWVCMLVVSTSLAYAMNVAVGGGPSAQDPQGAASAALAPAGRSPFSSDEEDGSACALGPCGRSGRWLPSTTGSCDTDSNRQQYVGLNSWIPAEPKVGPCPDTLNVAVAEGSSARDQQGAVEAVLAFAERSATTVFVLDDDDGTACGGASCGRWLPLPGAATTHQ
jgi:hypothetical protein